MEIKGKSTWSRGNRGKTHSEKTTCLVCFREENGPMHLEPREPKREWEETGSGRMRFRWGITDKGRNLDFILITSFNQQEGRFYV